MRRVFVASAGFTKVGDHWGSGLGDLAFEAFSKLKPNIKPTSLIVSNMLSGQTSGQEQLGAYIADCLQIEGTPAFRVEAGGASGGVAVHAAYSQIRSGMAESVLVIGTEKMRDLGPREVIRAASMAESSEYTLFHGASDAALHAMLVRLYMDRHKVKRDELSSIPVLAHRNAITAEHAQFRKAITIEDVSKSPIVSDPLRVLDCSPVGDGAAALLLVGDKLIEKFKGPRVEIASSSLKTQRLNVYERDDMLNFEASSEAVTEALRGASIGIDEIDFLEIHDSFSISTTLFLESIGLSKPGQGARDAWEGRYDRGGNFPINTFGGLKGRGNPIGATGVYQIAEAFLQLTNNSGSNQIPNARMGLIHSQGGVDSTASVHILKRVEG